jgi:hypothetical protein
VLKALGHFEVSMTGILTFLFVLRNMCTKLTYKGLALSLRLSACFHWKITEGILIKFDVDIIPSEATSNA